MNNQREKSGNFVINVLWQLLESFQSPTAIYQLNIFVETYQSPGDKTTFILLRSPVAYGGWENVQNILVGGGGGELE